MRCIWDGTITWEPPEVSLVTPQGPLRNECVGLHCEETQGAALWASPCLSACLAPLAQLAKAGNQKKNGL